MLKNKLKVTCNRKENWVTDGWDDTYVFIRTYYEHTKLPIAPSAYHHAASKLREPVVVEYLGEQVGQVVFFCFVLFCSYTARNPSNRPRGQTHQGAV